jgi:hypothetical protein
MRISRLWKAVSVVVGLAIAYFVASLLCLRTLSGASSLLPYNAAWDQIHVGDTEAEAARKYPGIHQELHSEKGDFCFDEHFYGSWTMQIVYDASDKVREKRFILRIGTKQNFKAFFYGEDT